MKCPKCGYLGFETSERCRNCGYDFSLAVEISGPADELPLRSSAGAGEPLADFDLSDFDTGPPVEDVGRLDLDRVIGDPAPGTEGALGALGAAGAPGLAGQAGAARVPGAPGAADVPRHGRLGAAAFTNRAPSRAPDEPTAPTSLGGRSAQAAPRARSAPSAPSAPGVVPPLSPGELPLFGGDDDTPLITAPRPVRPPLSVRRTTPEIPRVRPRPTQPSPRPEDGEPAFHNHLEAATQAHTTLPRDLALTPASPAARLGAAVIDLVLLGMINAAVGYLTLALTGLTWQEYDVLPLAPLVGFFAILDGGYLIVFVAAAGQTIGKMVTGVRVIGDDGQPVDIAGAVLRTAGCAASLLTLGLGYLPAFFAADRRALQDRIAGTQVVRAR
jgi:uncharacterized RDD family membrane protein YckC